MSVLDQNISKRMKEGDHDVGTMAKDAAGIIEEAAATKPSLKRKNRGETNARGKTNKNRRSNSRNWNRRRQKKVIRNLQEDLVFKTQEKSPIPVILLTPEQSEHIAKCAIVVELMKVVKNNAQVQSSWKRIQEGEDFSTTSTGHIVAWADDIINAKATHKQTYGPKNFRIVGDLEGIDYHGRQVLLATWNGKKQFKNNEQTSFSLQLLDAIRAIKKSVLKKPGQSHHKSCGEHYGHGSHASYSRITDENQRTSVRRYSTKSTKNLSKKVKALLAGRTVEEVDNQHMDHVAGQVKLGMESIREAYGPAKGTDVVHSGTVMNTAIVEGGLTVNPKLKEHVELVGDTKFPAVFLNFNAETKDLHMECDTSMTLIFVPLQEFLSMGEKSGTFFQFHLSDHDVIEVEMGVGMAIFFSGFFLTHRQVRKEGASDMANVSAFGSKPFFDNMRQTVGRQLEESDSQFLEIVHQKDWMFLA